MVVDSSKPKRAISFTIVPTDSGFTDQMLQFSAFYRLGLSLGYRYRHKCFFSNRSMELPPSRHVLRTHRGINTRFRQGMHRRWNRLWKSLELLSVLYQDVYDFVGFNSFFAPNQEPWATQPRVIDLELSDDLLGKNRITTLEELQRYIRHRVFTDSGSHDTVLVKFRVTGTWNFFGLIFSAIPDYPDGLDWRTVYFSTRRKRRWKSRFSEGKIKMLVHIRQGDTAVIKTPWTTYIPLWPPNQHSFVEYDEFSAIPGNHQLLQVSDYYHFIQNLTRQVDDGKFSIIVFSDGFRRSFCSLMRKIDTLDLTLDQINLLYNKQKSYERVEFASFKSMKHSQLVVGESPRKLYDFIHSCLTADVIVTGPHQALIPKLLANYCNADSMPIIIVLLKIGDDRERHVRYHEVVGLRGGENKFIYVTMGEIDYSQIARRVMHL